MGTSKRKRAVFKRLGHLLEEGVRLKLADGYYRVRRGKLVRIPDEWVGCPSELCGEKIWRQYLQRRRPRASKDTRKRRMQSTEPRGNRSRHRVPRDRFERAKKKGRKYWHGGSGGHPRNWAPRHCLGHRLRKLHDCGDE